MVSLAQNAAMALASASGQARLLQLHKPWRKQAKSKIRTRPGLHL